QHNYGLSGQISWLARHNRIIAGAGWDRSSMTFQQGSQFGYLDPDRISITPIDAFADGSTESDGVPVDTRVNLRGLIDTFSVFAMDSLDLGKPLALTGKSLTLTVSGRYNRTSLD